MRIVLGLFGQFNELFFMNDQKIVVREILVHWIRLERCFTDLNADLEFLMAHKYRTRIANVAQAPEQNLNDSSHKYNAKILIKLTRI